MRVLKRECIHFEWYLLYNAGNNSVGFLLYDYYYYSTHRKLF